eukprot:gene2549-2790_t
MIGQDYYTWGSKRHILSRFGDNHGHPYPGPIFLNFLEGRDEAAAGGGGGKLLLWNRQGSLYIQNCLTGAVETFIHPLSQRVVVQKQVEALVDAEYFAGEDWPSRFLTDSQLSSSPSARPAQHVYADFLPLAVCLLPPPSSLIAVADVSLKVKLFDLSAQAVQSSFGSAGLEVGAFSQPTALESVSLLGGQQTVLLVGDSGANQRLYCFSLTGQLIAWLGEKGPMPGQFRDIASLSACIDYARTSPHRGGAGVDLLHFDYLPRWYRGLVAMEDLEENLFDPLLESNFVLGQRLHEARTYDLLHITSSKRIQRLLIREEVDEFDHRESKGFYIANRTGDKVNYPSLFDLIRSQKDLHFREECRDSLLIAAVDRKNFRVQIVRFFWTKSFLFAPKMEVIMILGGIKNRQCVLRDPVCAKYGNNKELCICDNGADAVLILSSNYEVVKTISLTYLSAKEALFIGKKTENSKFALTKMEKENARKPCWMSISSTGQLAIGYKSGGVYVFEQGRSRDAGLLNRLESRSLEKIVCDYLAYSDIVSLRNACVFLHDFTRELRYSYKFFPPSQRGYINHVLDFFLHSSRHGADGLNNIRNLQLVDALQKPICPFHLKGNCQLGSKCNLSHRSVAYDRTDLQLSQAYLLKEDVDAIVNQLYGPHFFYKYDVYLQELFLAYASDHLVNMKKDPMTRRNEVIRSNIPQTRKVVFYVSFLEVMIVIAEHVSGFKDITEHKLFSGAGRQRFLPSVATNLESLSNPEVYPDLLEQYDHPLNIPAVKHRKGLHMISKAGFKENEKVRGKVEYRYCTDHAGDVYEHVDQVNFHVDRANALINKLFK